MHIHFDGALGAWLDVYLRIFGPGMLKSLGMDKETTDASLHAHAQLLTEVFSDSKCGKFVFDEYPPDGIEEFGVQLLREDMFRLPFDTCYFQWPYNGGTFTLFARMNDVGKLELFSVGKPSQDQDWGAGFPFQISMSGIGSRLRNGGGLLPWTGAPNVHAESVETCINELIACVSLLAAKGLEKELVEPKPAVNKRRAASGRRELPSYTIIRLAKRRGDGNGGTHASPRPHMRRGHVRQLDDERKTVVRPHFVMADPGALPTYRIPKP
jgi:hypothetical protein